MNRPPRYRLRPYRGSRKNRYVCPNCKKAHAFSRWEDTRTGELLPEEFGRCNREDQCGYVLSPYDKGATGLSYADAQRLNSPPGSVMPRQKLKPRPAPTLCIIPESVLQRSLGHYDQNTLAHLLQTHFGLGVAKDLLRRFEIGTSAYWPGATVFWQRDELGRIRGGQVVGFNPSGHTAKRPGRDGTPQRCTTWVHTALADVYRRRGQPQPDWLTAYLDESNCVAKSPSLYGLVQLATAAPGQSVALVESPKTAVICSVYFPEFVWLATGGLSYLTSERLQPVKAHKLMLYPDASRNGSAYRHWRDKADAFNQQGFDVNVSDFLEKSATEAQRAAGIDLADLLLEQWDGYPPSWD